MTNTFLQHPRLFPQLIHLRYFILQASATSPCFQSSRHSSLQACTSFYLVTSFLFMPATLASVQSSWPFLLLWHPQPLGQSTAQDPSHPVSSSPLASCCILSVHFFWIPVQVPDHQLKSNTLRTHAFLEKYDHPTLSHFRL